MKRMNQTLVFFRDDDVGEMTAPLEAMMDALLDAAVPCHYQVVPEYLDEAASDRLRALQSAHPDLVFLNQHGLRHAQVLDGQRVATEFAGNRPFEDQLSDIRQGRDMLRDALAESFAADIFTPPCHKFDAATLRALGDLGFETLSAGVRADWRSRAFYALGHRLGKVTLLGQRVSYHLRKTPDARLREISVAIDAHEDLDAAGRRLDKSVDMLWREFEVCRTRLSVVGVMLHHQACETAEKQAALRAFVARLKADPGVQVGTMPEVWSRPD